MSSLVIELFVISDCFHFICELTYGIHQCVTDFVSGHYNCAILPSLELVIFFPYAFVNICAAWKRRKEND